MRKKPSFFERLTGSIHVDDTDTDDAVENKDLEETFEDSKEVWANETEGELSVDVHQNEDEVIIKTMVAGVNPNNIEVNVTRDMVTIRGERQNEHEVRGDDYFHRELYWGAFSRTIMLPCEIEAEETTAKAENGLLTITLPKIDKHKQTKVKVKAS